MLLGFGIGDHVVERPIVERGVPADLVGLDFLAFEPVFQVALDGNLAVGIIEEGRRAGAAGWHFVHFEGEASTLFGIVELAVDAAGKEGGGVSRFPVEGERRAQAFALDIIVAILDRVGIGEAVFFVPTVHFHIVGRCLAIIIGQAAGNSERVGNRDREVDRALGRCLAVQVIVGTFQNGADIEVFAIEGLGRVDFDRGADRVGVHFRDQCLLHFDGFDEFRGDYVECNGAGVGLGRGHAHAVERGGVQRRVKSAYGDETAFALVVQDIDAGQAAG